MSSPSINLTKSISDPTSVSSEKVTHAPAVITSLKKESNSSTDELENSDTDVITNKKKNAESNTNAEPQAKKIKIYDKAEENNLDTSGDDCLLITNFGGKSHMYLPLYKMCSPKEMIPINDGKGLIFVFNSAEESNNAKEKLNSSNTICVITQGTKEDFLQQQQNNRPENQTTEDSSVWVIESDSESDINGWTDNLTTKELYGLSKEYLQKIGITFPLTQWIHISNFHCERSVLREVLDLAGKVLVCNVYRTRAGYAKVMYSHPIEAAQAVSILHGQKLYGSVLNVVMCKFPPTTTMLPAGLAAIGSGFGLKNEPLRDVVKEYKKLILGQPSTFNTELFTWKEHETEDNEDANMDIESDTEDEIINPEIIHLISQLKADGVTEEEIVAALKSLQPEGKTKTVDSAIIISDQNEDSEVQPEAKKSDDGTKVSDASSIKSDETSRKSDMEEENNTSIDKSSETMKNGDKDKNSKTEDKSSTSKGRYVCPSERNSRQMRMEPNRNDSSSRQSRIDKNRNRSRSRSSERRYFKSPMITRPQNNTRTHMVQNANNNQFDRNMQQNPIVNHIWKPNFVPNMQFNTTVAQNQASFASAVQKQKALSLLQQFGQMPQNAVNIRPAGQIFNQPQNMMGSNSMTQFNTNTQMRANMGQSCMMNNANQNVRQFVNPNMAAAGNMGATGSNVGLMPGGMVGQNFGLMGTNMANNANAMMGLNKKTVVVCNLPPTVTLQILRSKLSECGEICQLRPEAPGVAKVTYSADWEAQRCINKYNKTTVNGRTIEVFLE